MSKKVKPSCKINKSLYFKHVNCKTSDIMYIFWVIYTYLHIMCELIEIYNCAHLGYIFPRHGEITESMVNESALGRPVQMKNTLPSVYNKNKKCHYYILVLLFFK